MFPPNKTKIVCTIGPASESIHVMRDLLRSGMNVARLNFSHGDFNWHEMIIHRLRQAATAEGKRLALMADLPGPKIRIGQINGEPVQLKEGNFFDLVTEDSLGNETKAFVNLPSLPSSVKPGNFIYLNDGVIQLEVKEVTGSTIRCQVLSGGELRSRKGVNLPGIDLGISAFTERDQECLQFALEHGVDAVSQSFVSGPKDIEKVRSFSKELGYKPFIIAKIERAIALDHVDAIMRTADAIMIARGDLGVEIPIKTLAIIQKQLTARANALGKPVITATQMLASMTTRQRPTRAEVTDVANAILDGTDCVMLSEESAMGMFPVESVAMLARIAAATEPYRPPITPWETTSRYGGEYDEALADFMSRNVNHAVELLRPTVVIVPTASGHTARMISRFKLPVWIIAVSTRPDVCQNLQFSYGIHALFYPIYPENWETFSRKWIEEQQLDSKGLAILIQGPSPEHPDANPAIEVITPITK